MGEHRFMKRAIELSREGVCGGHGFPFGTVIVKNDEIIGEGFNQVPSTNDPTAHAEVIAIRKAGARLETFDLSGCDLYVNGVPCCMCLGAILWSRVSRVFYALDMQACVDIGLPHEHLFKDFSRPLGERSIPFVAMPELNHEARAVYELWANSPDTIKP